MRIGVCGPKTYASFTMRGRPLIREYGYEWIPPDKPLDGSFDVILIVKRLVRWRGSVFPSGIFEATARIVVDPLDWWDNRERRSPQSLWRRFHEEILSSRRISQAARGAAEKRTMDGCEDTCIATSPACESVMREAFPDGTDIRMVPHAADPLIGPDWYDPRGPVVYAGLPKFIDGLQANFERACARIGRKFVADYSFNSQMSLQGAALAVAVRNRRHDNPYIRHCKAQVKLANASMASMPALCLGTPAERSLYPSAATITHEEMEDVNLLAERISQALDAGLPGPANHETDYLRAMREILEEQ